MKVVHVSTAHPLPDVRILVRECRTLAAAGHDVTLYGRTESEHVDQGVRLKPVPEPGSRVKRMTTGPWRLLKPLLAENADVYHLHDPELIPLGLTLRARRRTVVFDAHEPLPLQVYDKPYIPQPLRPVVSGLTRVLIAATGRGMSAIVAASPVAAETFRGRGGKKVVTVNNFPAVDASETVPAYDKERPRDIVYVGGLSLKRGWREILEVARILNETRGIRITLAGPFHPPALEQELTDDVEYLGMLAPEAARAVMVESKVGLVLFQRTRAHERAMPNKLFEYMAAGLPIVASDFEHWNAFIEKAGVQVRPDDPAAIVEAIESILDDPVGAAGMSEHGRRAAAESYTWNSEAAKLLSLYDSLDESAP